MLFLLKFVLNIRNYKEEKLRILMEIERISEFLNENMIGFYNSGYIKIFFEIQKNIFLINVDILK